MTTQPTSDALRIVKRAIDFILMFVVCVAIRANCPPEYLFVGGWFCGGLFVFVYLAPWEKK